MQGTGSIRPMDTGDDMGKDAGADEEIKAEDNEQQQERHSEGEDERREVGRNEEGEEGRLARGITAPMRVSDREREEHELTHTPYRAWCPYCVRARGKNTSHRKSKDEDKDKQVEVPRISMDYFFMSQEDEKASSNPIMVMVDENTGEKYARAVGQKGIGKDHEMDWLVKDMSNELKAWGHSGGPEGKIILKSDGEPAIVAVREALARYHGGIVIPEGPAVGESASNGTAEEAGKTVREFARVIKEHLEDKAKIKIGTQEAIVQWIVRWAAMLVSRYLVGRDGRTAYERRRGRACRAPVAAFGEKVWYKQVRDSKERKDKFESEWMQGIWLGHSRNTNETIIGTKEGTVRAYAIKRQDPDQRWDEQWVKQIVGTPQRPDPNRGDLTIPIKARFDPPTMDAPEPTEAPRKEPGMRRMKITATMLEKYGRTEGCEGCKSKAAGLNQRPHSEACRSRIEEALEADDEGQVLRRKAVERENQRLAEEMEKELGKIDPGPETEAQQQAPASEAAAEPDRQMAEEDAQANEEPKVATQEKRMREEEASEAKRARVEEAPEEPKQEEESGAQSSSEMVEMLRNMGVSQCSLVDLTEGWNFCRPKDRERAEELIKAKKPNMVIGSIGRGHSGAHAKFLTKIYEQQAQRGQWFGHDQPLQGSRGAMRLIMDLDMYGPMTSGVLRRSRENIRVVTNCGEVGEVMNKVKMGSKTRDYKEVMTAGISEATKLRQMKLMKLVTVERGMEIKELHHDGDHEDEARNDLEAWDDVTGAMLDPKEVRKARLKELQYIHEKKVWIKIPRRRAIREGYKIVKGRWIDINKGDMTNWNYRSRYVAKEFNTGEEDGLFASTPPLEALRLLISDAATVQGNEERVIMINDVARAFFEAPAKRNICVELPEEELQGEDCVGLLLQSLYGTRDASANFQEEIRKVLCRSGFARGRYNPSTYYHPEMRIKAMVHGDDFVSTGTREALQWFRSVLEARFEISTTVIGSNQKAGEVQEAKVLNRIIRMDKDGWHYEADQRHAELIIKTLNLEGAKSVQTPGEEEKPWLEEENKGELETKDAGHFRALAARANYLALDRPDIQYAVKEICRGMSRPTRGDLARLRRLARYLVGRPRSVWEFPYQEEGEELSGYTDSDWAGCRRTARSTSGGAILRGNHTLKTWSATQKNITLSSGEAELVAMVKMSTETIGLLQLAGEWGMNLRGNIYADSSAALGVVKRRGCGKLRHVKVGMLWVQEKQETGELQYTKVKGTNNPADLMTTNVNTQTMDKIAAILGQRFQKGRAEHSLQL